MMNRKKIKAHVFRCLATVMLIFLFSLSNEVFAQETQKSAVEQYVNSHPDDPLVKYYLFDKSNASAATAVKSAFLLEQSNQYTEEERLQFQSHIDAVTRVIKNIESQVKAGASYERAAKSSSQQANNDRSQNSTSKGLENTDNLPVLTIPGK